MNEASPHFTPKGCWTWQLTTQSFQLRQLLLRLRSQLIGCFIRGIRYCKLHLTTWASLSQLSCKEDTDKHLILPISISPSPLCSSKLGSWYNCWFCFLLLNLTNEDSLWGEKKAPGIAHLAGINPSCAHIRILSFCHVTLCHLLDSALQRPPARHFSLASLLAFGCVPGLKPFNHQGASPLFVSLVCRFFCTELQKNCRKR